MLFRVCDLNYGVFLVIDFGILKEFDFVVFGGLILFSFFDEFDYEIFQINFIDGILIVGYCYFFFGVKIGLEEGFLIYIMSD